MAGETRAFARLLEAVEREACRLDRPEGRLRDGVLNRVYLRVYFFTARLPCAWPLVSARPKIEEFPGLGNAGHTLRAAAAIPAAIGSVRVRIS